MLNSGFPDDVPRKLREICVRCVFESDAMCVENDHLPWLVISQHRECGCVQLDTRTCKAGVVRRQGTDLVISFTSGFELQGDFKVELFVGNQCAAALDSKWESKGIHRFELRRRFFEGGQPELNDSRSILVFGAWLNVAYIAETANMESVAGSDLDKGNRFLFSSLQQRGLALELEFERAKLGLLGRMSLSGGVSPESLCGKVGGEDGLSVASGSTGEELTADELV